MLLPLKIVKNAKKTKVISHAAVAHPLFKQWLLANCKLLDSAFFDDQAPAEPLAPQIKSACSIRRASCKLADCINVVPQASTIKQKSLSEPCFDVIKFTIHRMQFL